MKRSVSLFNAIFLRAYRNCGGGAYIEHYEDFIKSLVVEGYSIIPLKEVNSDKAQNGRTSLARHDVDISSVSGNRQFYNIEKRHGARSTFYFRLSTIKAHKELIAELISEGFEVGYHFEEVATAVKKYGLRSKEDVYRQSSVIRDEFARNVDKFRGITGLNQISVSDHGDWANRLVGVNNRDVIPSSFMHNQGVLFEAYDLLINQVEYLTDTQVIPPNWKVPVSEHFCFLAHERNWSSDPLAHWGADWNRLCEAFKFKFKVGTL